MLFDLIKSLIWISGILVIGYFLLGFSGYEINSEYFSYSRSVCEKKLRECGGKVIQRDKKFECDIKCVEPELIIKKINR